ncbi:MAG: tripartite tricarboxylate transporter substrate binding protein [Eubacteriales bacterium]
MLKKALVCAVAMAMTAAVCSCGTNTDTSTSTSGSADPGTSQQETQSGYPEREIQIVIPMGTGGDTDLNARIFSKYLEEELGVPLVCNNVTGAGGAVGARQVKDADPDGYTALFFQYAGLIQQMTGVVDFSYVDDFEIAGIGMFDKCNLWLGSANGKYETLEDLVEDAKANPGKINIGTSGTGNMAHFLVKMLEEQAGVTFNIVDLGGQSQLQAALMSGQIAAYTGYYSNSKSFIDSGDFRVLGVFTEEESHPLLPDAPTMNEQGFDMDFLNDKYYYYAFPKGTPEEVINRFSEAMQKVCENPEVQKEFDQYFVTVEYMSPEESVEYIKNLESQYNEYKSVFDQ